MRSSLLSLSLAIFLAGCGGQSLQLAQPGRGEFAYAGPDPQPGTFEVASSEMVQLAMRDGARLATRITLPEGDGPWPVVLIRTPYGREGDANAWGEETVVSHGYVFVSQDMRGKGDSDGEPHIWDGEAQDGFDTIEWIAQQPWCNGSVGMIGGSALGYAQWAAASLRPSALKSICVFTAISDPFFGGAYDHGVFSLPPFSAYEAMHRTPPDRPEWDEAALRTLPLSQLDDAIFGHNVPTWETSLSRNGHAFWPTPHWPQAVESVDIPVLMFMTLWDGDGIGPVLNWEVLRDAGNSKARLIFGPWGHSLNPMDRRGDVSYGDKAPVRLMRILLSWLEATLGEGSSDVDQFARAQVFHTGANEWRTYAEWPPPQAHRQTLYLRRGLGAAADRLSEDPPQNRESVSYSYDPMSPQRSLDTATFNETTQAPFDPADPDNAIFLSGPLERDLTIAGPLELDLRFSTTGTDTDFFAFLLDIDESGTMRVVSQPGKIRASFLNGLEEPGPLIPNEVYSARIRLWDVAHEFRRGHRVGVAIRSEWFPRWSRNLNVFQPLASGTEWAVATQTLHLTPDQPSTLSFSVVD